MIAANPTREVGFTSSVEVKVTEKTIQQFAELSGDFNPIHMDEEYAKTTRFKRRIAHGMIAGAFISRSLVEVLGAGGVYLGQSLKFVAPIYIDDVILVELKVTNVRKDRGIGIIETIVKKKESGEICVKGEATIMYTEAI